MVRITSHCNRTTEPGIRLLEALFFPPPNVVSLESRIGRTPLASVTGRRSAERPNHCGEEGHVKKNLKVKVESKSLSVYVDSDLFTLNIHCKVFTCLLRLIDWDVLQCDAPSLRQGEGLYNPGLERDARV